MFSIKTGTVISICFVLANWNSLVKYYLLFCFLIHIIIPVSVGETQFHRKKWFCNKVNQN